MTFPLVSHSAKAKVFTRLSLLMAVGIALSSTLLFVAGMIEGTAALLFGLGFPASIGVIGLSWFVFRGGEAQLDAQGIELRGPGGRERYAWEHISALQIRRFEQCSAAERLFAGVLGIRSTEAFVEMRLKRSFRLGLWSTSGTAGFGIPGIGVKTTRIYVADPAGFVEEAEKYLRRTTAP